jgi:signal peptidase II
MQAAAGTSLNDVAPRPVPSHRTLVTALGVLAALVLVVDQVTKALAVAWLQPDRPVPLLGDLLQLRITRNAGAAFSMATGATWLLTLVAVMIVVVVLRSVRRLGSRGWALSLGLLLGGALGNLVDRLVREPGVGRGHVVDFIAYGHLFIGNVADIAIVLAAGLMALLSIRGTRIEGRAPEAPAGAGSAPERPDEEPDTPAGRRAEGDVRG